MSNHFYNVPLCILGISDLKVWTSSLVRTIQTAANVSASKVAIQALDEISAGKFDGFTYEEVAEKYPEEFKARDIDKLCYRYPDGMSQHFSLFLGGSPGRGFLVEVSW
jgi:broad specificity phosphatase PhoE